LKELNKVDSIGPIMLGLSKPVHFQLGVRRGNGNMTAMCYWCQEKQKKKAVKILMFFSRRGKIKPIEMIAHLQGKLVEKKTNSYYRRRCWLM
jgi:hypothetical protein